MTREELEKEAEESCPDCFCEDCAKDCGIKKLGLVKTRGMTDFEKMYRELKEVWLKASFTEEERQLLACALSEWIRSNESDEVMASNIVLARDLFRRIIGIEDCHKSCGCKEVPAWIDGYNRGKEDVKYDLMMKLKDEGIVILLKDSIFTTKD